jgi:hypothetical protein
MLFNFMEFIKNMFKLFKQKLTIMYTLIMAEKFHYISKFILSHIFIAIFAIFIYSHTRDIAFLFSNISESFTSLLRAIGVLKEIVPEPEPEPVIEIITPQEKPKRVYTTDDKLAIGVLCGYFLIGTIAITGFCLGVPIPILGQLVFFGP